jgi:hypothetical protein
LARTQSLIEFLKPYVGGTMVPYITAIRILPKMGIEDDDFIELWKAATLKCGKWLTERSFDQSKVDLAVKKKAFTDSLTLLERESSVISWPENQQKFWISRTINSLNIHVREQKDSMSMLHPKSRKSALGLTLPKTTKKVCLTGNQENNKT